MMKRKPHQGSIYNKERTKQKLIAAVGKILVKDGFQNIKINKIELVSGVSKKLIYRYFNGLNGLIKAYLLQADYWNQQIQQTSTEGHPDKEEPLELEEIFSIIKSDFEYFDRFREMQKIILWGISTKNKTLKDIAANRELFGKKIFERSDIVFGKSDIDFRAVTGILVSAVYYIVLHGKMLGTTICEIDSTKKEGKARFVNAINKLLELCYEHRQQQSGGLQ